MHLNQNSRRRLLSQEGFTMAIVMGVMMVISGVGLAAYAAANGDVRGSGQDRDRKSAYAAAEAGINWYISRLSGDNAYWAKCATVPVVASGQPAPVNQQWNGSGTDPRRWRVLAGSTAQYTIELLPAPGYTSCSTTTPDKSMIDPASGTIRIRATGRYHNAKRSIVTQFRRARFLDFLYFTDFETTDPLAYQSSDVATANAQCANKYRWTRTGWCREIQFADFDRINGPLHSNDDLLICGSPVFGRSTADRIEVSGPTAPGYNKACTPTVPNFVGPFKYAQPTMQMPASLAGSVVTQNVLPAYTYTGKTNIVLNPGGTMNVTTGNPQVTTLNVAWPSNGLIFVKNGSCGWTLPPIDQDYSEPIGCANVSVSGTYTQDLTIGSEKDILIAGNITKTGDPLMGLIANNFVRVKHQVDDSCNNVAAGTMSTVTVEAAILSLQHSFTVDNYNCGAGLGDLVVKGAIAQRYRGAVGTGGMSASYTGYKKNYNYDDRLRYRNPPFFLEPVSAAWRVLRMNEQVPAR
jgi:Tfp pilus assembly protein PilX